MMSFEDKMKLADSLCGIEKSITAKELSDRIKDYLWVGGMWNPECMEHDKVRDLLMDCRTFLNTI